jgi:hypothetical protein
MRAFRSRAATTVLQGEECGRELPAMQVKQGRMELGAAQRGSAADWTQFLNESEGRLSRGKVLLG